jgi:hypothetical protein
MEDFCLILLESYEQTHRKRLSGRGCTSSGRATISTVGLRCARSITRHMGPEIRCGRNALIALKIMLAWQFQMYYSALI